MPNSRVYISFNRKSIFYKFPSSSVGLFFPVAFLPPGAKNHNFKTSMICKDLIPPSFPQTKHTKSKIWCAGWLGFNSGGYLLLLYHVLDAAYMRKLWMQISKYLPFFFFFFFFPSHPSQKRHNSQEKVPKRSLYFGNWLIGWNTQNTLSYLASPRFENQGHFPSYFRGLGRDSM